MLYASLLHLGMRPAGSATANWHGCKYTCGSAEEPIGIADKQISKHDCKLKTACGQLVQNNPMPCLT